MSGPGGNQRHRESPTVRESADQLRESANAAVRSADLTTTLAADRTVLAAERTYAAWVRTGLALLASGVGVNAFLTSELPKWIVRVTGSLLIIFSALCFIAAVWRVLKRVPAQTTPNVRALPTSLLYAMTGVFIAIDIAALIGIWVFHG